MLRPLRHFWNCTSGASLVEVTLVMPLAIALMVGGVEFGRALYAYHTADKAVKSAARYLARLPTAAVNQSWALTKARNLVLTGTLDGSGGPLIRGWTDPNTITLTAASPTNIIHLEARVPFNTPMLSAINLPDRITFTVKHEERYISE